MSYSQDSIERNPHGYRCPVCDSWVPIADSIGHCCPERSLRGIDSAHSRDPDEEEPRRKSFGARLADGFAMMRGRG